MDDGYHMLPDQLDELIREDRRAGLLPWLVVASAGTTDVGAIDPLGEVGRIAREHDVWYHVDAAYGGFFALVDELRPRLAGMAEADSVVLDPHKGLFLPFGTGAILVRDKAALLRAHSFQAHYMQDALSGEALDDASPGDMSPEFSRHFRGPRVWLPLQLHGVRPFRAALEEKHLLARHFHEQVRRLGFEVGPEPELSVATYRYVPGSGDADAFNRALLREIHRDGRSFVSSTTLGGNFVLRAAVLSFRTHLEHIERYLEFLGQAVTRLGG
jgi:glutamate/tyrosine decarboxylase-like PLP-dependent enzyme